MDLPYDLLEDIVRRALREDIGHGDLTTLATIPADAQAKASLVSKEAGVVAGLPVVTAVYQAVDPSLVVSPQVTEGETVEAGTILAHISGGARGILTGERVALNFLQRMSGIATLTARYVALVRDLPVRLLDTRKTTPGLRVLEKYAVVKGGGVNHRVGLYDAVMLKDNHLALLSAHGCDISEAVRRARAAVGPLVNIEVEVESVEQARQAAADGADVILLDNMTGAAMREAVAAVGHRVVLEASGGITLETIRAVAETGVNYISVGALTHSARALDISLDVVATQ
ncbi:MAG: carboxylating nicotinate-nucleotide diphosphorylase [Chloroflexaceae bacterium]|nr:carboxylating nicotinate-nucleotide diphosphorylase [Chloroflexaceae bacterium]